MTGSRKLICSYCGALLYDGREVFGCDHFYWIPVDDRVKAYMMLKENYPRFIFAIDDGKYYWILVHKARYPE